MISSFHFIVQLSQGSVLVSFGLVVLLTVFKNVTVLLKGAAATAVSDRFTFDADEIIPVSTVLIATGFFRYRSIKGIIEAA